MKLGGKMNVEVNNANLSVPQPLSSDRFKKDIILIESEPICPSCKKTLNKRPTRKTRCPSCGNDIYVRSKPRVFSSTLLTKDESMAVDWLNKLENYGIGQKDYIDKREELTKKFGRSPKPTDIIWKLYNGRIQEEIKSGNLWVLKSLNWDMALFLYEEGKEFFESLQESQKMHLMKYKQQGLVKVRIASSGNCPACIDMMGKVLAIEVALKEMPIPVKDCTFKLHGRTPGWCGCRYIPYLDDPEIDVPQSIIDKRKEDARLKKVIE
nr:MAG: hypothetical protein OI716_00875 [Candidatus Methanoperedens sp.]WAI00102.1 MAG: hypothetical protein OI720_00720 [Candidatus Methanoperedens sp.]